MRVGIGLPTTMPGIDRSVLTEWARRADAARFSTLAVLDRLAYDSVDPFAALAAAAAVTERIHLATMIAIGPLRQADVLAANADTLRALSGGRFTLGVAVGARRDDYDVAGLPHRDRGTRLTEQLAHLRVHDADFGLLVGGDSGPAHARMARYADGYVHGGGPPRAFASSAGRARAAWREFDRPGQPRLWGQGYFALGDAERGADYLRDYYAFTGPFAEKVAAANLTSRRAIKDFIRGYEAEGCDELVLFPTVADVAQLDRLAEAVHG